MDSSGYAGRKALLVLSFLIAVVGAWLWLMPFFGPPGTQESQHTIVHYRYGTRGLCRPAIIGVVAATLSDGPRVENCQRIGAGRWENGWLAFFAASVLAVTTTRAFRVRDREGPAE